MESRAALFAAVLLVIFSEIAIAQSRRTPAPAPQPFRYTREEQEACLPDAQRLCDLAQQPTIIMACLRRQWDEVSEECRAVMDRRKE